MKVFGNEKWEINVLMDEDMGGNMFCDGYTVESGEFWFECPTSNSAKWLCGILNAARRANVGGV